MTATPKGRKADDERFAMEAADEAAVDNFLHVCRTGSGEAFQAAALRLDKIIGGWTVAMRAVDRHLRSVRIRPEIQQAFMDIWVKLILPAFVRDRQTLRNAAWILLPPYRGPAVRLYRGAGACERRHHSYGMSWTTDATAAERFALVRQQQHWNGGSVVLETLAPAAAIICAVDYQKPFTVETLNRHCPELSPQEIQEFVDDPGFHNEREYIVDSRRLGAVNVIRRYAQLPITKLDCDPTDADAA